MFELTNTNKYSLFIHPKKQFKRFKWAYNRISKEDINQQFNITNETDLSKESRKKFDKFINNIICGKSPKELFLNALIADGFSPSESKSILDQAIYHTKRAADWAHDNEINSGKASKWILSSMMLGILKNSLNGFDINPFGLKYITSIFQNFTAGMRGLKQFTIYGERPDEDRAENLYEAEKYGNKICGLFADLAYIFETKINWWILPFIGSFNDRLQSTIKSLISLPNILWWRIRMPSEINQRFATDILNYIIHKPLSLMGNKQSNEKLKEIAPDNLSLKYINKRLRSLIGLNEGKDKSVSIKTKIIKEIKSLFKGNHNEKIAASIRINKLISPFLGFYGFFTTLIGTTLNSLFTLFGKENRFLDSFTQTSGASQQLIYFFRLILPEYLENKKTDINSSDPETIKLKSKRNASFYTAVSVFTMNIISVFLKLFKFENRALKLSIDIYDEIADKGIPFYLSWRRHILGHKFRVDNPELFESGGMPKAF